MLVWLALSSYPNVVVTALVPAAPELLPQAPEGVEDLRARARERARGIVGILRGAIPHRIQRVLDAVAVAVLHLREAMGGVIGIEQEASNRPA